MKAISFSTLALLAAVSTAAPSNAPSMSMAPSASPSAAPTEDEGDGMLGCYTEHANCACDTEKQNPCTCYSTANEASKITSTDPAFTGSNGSYGVTTTSNDHSVTILMACKDPDSFVLDIDVSHNKEVNCEAPAPYNGHQNEWRIHCKDKSGTHSETVNLNSFKCGKYEVVGEWIPYGQFPVGESSSISISQGYETGQVTTDTKTFQTSTTQSAQAGIKVKGVSGTTSLSQTQSQSLSDAQSNSWSSSQSWTMIDNLDDGDIGLLYWQWVYMVTQPDGSKVTAYSQSTGGGTFLAKTSDYSVTPKCVGGKMANKDLSYQTCVNNTVDGNWYLDPNPQSPGVLSNLLEEDDDDELSSSSAYVMVGSWATITQNIDSTELQFEQGSNFGSSQTVTTSYTNSVTKSASAGIEVQGVSASGSMSKTQSTEISNSDQRYWSQNYDSKVHLVFNSTYNGDVVWQWIYTVCKSGTAVNNCAGTPKSNSAVVSQVFTNYFAYGEEDSYVYHPKCVGGKCSNDGDGKCQECVDPSWELPQPNTTSTRDRRFLRGASI